MKLKNILFMAPIASAGVISLHSNHQYKTADKKIKSANVIGENKTDYSNSYKMNYSTYLSDMHNSNSKILKNKQGEELVQSELGDGYRRQSGKTTSNSIFLNTGDDAKVYIKPNISTYKFFAQGSKTFVR